MIFLVWVSRSRKWLPAAVTLLFAAACCERSSLRPAVSESVSRLACPASVAAPLHRRKCTRHALSQRLSPITEHHTPTTFVFYTYNLNCAGGTRSMAEQGTAVELYIYDLTNGLASLLSPSILGRQIEGVWHTGVVAYGREFFFGGGGISSCAPGGTQLGPPHLVEQLGQTFVPFQVFVDYLQGLSTTTYSPSAYNLLEHNCNHFSEEIAQFLCGAHIPKHIVAQPEELLAPSTRAAVQALLDNLVPHAAQMSYTNGGARHSRQDSPDYLTLNSQIEEARSAPEHWLAARVRRGAALLAAGARALGALCERHGPREPPAPRARRERPRGRPARDPRPRSRPPRDDPRPHHHQT